MTPLVRRLCYKTQRRPFFSEVNMWLKQVLNFAVNVCGTILLLFMLAMIGLLYTMTAILTYAR